MQKVIIHLLNEDPVVGEMEQLPAPTDTMLVVRNPTRKDGKDLLYLDTDANTVVWPVARVNFIEVLSSGSEDKLITHVRE